MDTIVDCTQCGNEYGPTSDDGQPIAYALCGECFEELVSIGVTPGDIEMEAFTLS